MIMIVMICLGVIIASPKSSAEPGESKMTEPIFERVDINVGAPTNTVLPLNLDDDNYLDLLAVGNGFYDQSHFHRHFKKQFGITPSAVSTKIRYC